MFMSANTTFTPAGGKSIIVYEFVDCEEKAYIGAVADGVSSAYRETLLNVSTT